jgi:hypothetical protein
MSDAGEDAKYVPLIDAGQVPRNRRIAATELFLLSKQRSEMIRGKSRHPVKQSAVVLAGGAPGVSHIHRRCRMAAILTATPVSLSSREQ